MAITPGLTIVELQTDAKGCSTKFYAYFDGTAYSLASTALLGGALVSATNPFPIANEGGTQPLAYNASTPSVAVSTSSTNLVAAGAFQSLLVLSTLPGQTGNVYLNVSNGAAVVGQVMCIQAGGGSQTFGTPAQPMPTGPITGISDSGTVTVMIAGK